MPTAFRGRHGQGRRKMKTLVTGLWPGTQAVSVAAQERTFRGRVFCQHGDVLIAARRHRLFASADEGGKRA